MTQCFAMMQIVYSTENKKEGCKLIICILLYIMRNQTGLSKNVDNMSFT